MQIHSVNHIADAGRSGIGRIGRIQFGQAGQLHAASSAAYTHQLNPTIASDFSYAYECSTDLVEWKRNGATNSGLTTATIASSPPVSCVVTVTTTITGGPTAKLFTPIKVQLP